MNTKEWALRVLERAVAKTNYRLITGQLADTSKLLELFASWSSGILHIGGHLGQESHWYSDLGKPVVWLEAMPDAVSIIEEITRHYPNQRVYQACLTNVDDQIVQFNVSSNNSGASSSLFQFGSASVGKASMWPELNLEMSRVLSLRTVTLDTLMMSNAIPIQKYDHWILDVQGAESLVIQGATESLKSCRSLVVEASSIEVYEGGAQWIDVKELLQESGFTPLWECLGHMDVLFVRKEQQWTEALTRDH